ncbi:monovalent cation:proton antiporter-2 (CPA2) family protein [Chelatococcus caeni]|uniref:Monovalent cation:proton antiporter-2 (CPA2) family protein n=1 Tax=Chelatococcus caeni TaxID=1348468 RepID=A0A840BRM4_9HYPH|nr:monovalent cation:proton antiporter-2 (CPA2) family protein [Chelatococcus caeni]MBB4015253.1 monovalent cation:proton antiporter-2 (CPA2) family protein [Chelatococcus caeni]
MAASAAEHASFLPPILTFCAAAVIAVPLFRKLGLGAVLGYLIAGIVIGPSVMGLVGEAENVRGVAELGVVLLLFIIGLELKISNLFAMRRDIFGLGLAQIVITCALVATVAALLGHSARGMIVTGLALSLSATAIALQVLEERHDLATRYGQRTFSILLFQDLSIVPILALVPLLANTEALGSGQALAGAAGASARAFAAVALVVIVGRYLLNPLFRLLAASGGREVMTAAALLVVLGAAMLMEQVGLSMAMGAFLAGVLLAESNFRHQLEADIEPFRGLLLGLFFMSVGMSLDANYVRQNALLLLVLAPALVIGKSLIAAALARGFGSSWPDALRIGALLAPAGEFSFVLVPLGGEVGLLTGERVQVITALAALTMLLGPLLAKFIESRLAQRPTGEEPAPDDLPAGEAGGSVIVIGFGRFGQVVNQVLLANGADVTVIDRNIDSIRSAARFGFKVYYGDGTRLDVLRAAGAGSANLVCVCVDDAAAALKIAEIVHAEFPRARTFVRAIDRPHAIALMNREVDFQLRETFESALQFGRATLEELGVDAEAARLVTEDVRRRDIARLVLQRSDGLLGGQDLLHGAKVKPEPLTPPKRKAAGLSAETRDLVADAEARP